MPTLAVRFLDVGQGDAILVQAPGADGAAEFYLIDAGRSETRIRELLADSRVARFEAIVATHPEADHIGGLDEVVASFEVREFIHNGAVSTTKAYRDLATAVATRRIPTAVAAAGDDYTWGCCLDVSVLHPGPLRSGNGNDDSIVLKAKYGKVAFMLTGDIEKTAEATIVAGYAPTPGALRADVLKVAHHGSCSSSTGAFVAEVGPSLAVLSVGARNAYGHPGAQVLQRLLGTGATLLRTDLEGTISVTTDGATVHSTKEMPSPPITPTPRSTCPPLEP